MKKQYLISAGALLFSLGVSACGTSGGEPTSSKGGEVVSSSQQSTSGKQTSSQTPSSNSSPSSSSSSAPEKKTINLDLGDFIANVQDAKSLSIKNVNKASPRGMRRNAVSDDEEPVLVKSSVEYAEDGTVVDENGEVEVSFKKMTTTTKTTEINGQEAYIPFEDGTKKEVVNKYFVTFAPEAGIAYSIYDDKNYCEAFDVEDNNDLDLDKRDGIIKIEVHKDGVDYRLRKFRQINPNNQKTNVDTRFIESYPGEKDSEGNITYYVQYQFWGAVSNNVKYELYDLDGTMYFEEFTNDCDEDADKRTDYMKFAGLPHSGNYILRIYSPNDGNYAPVDVDTLSPSMEDAEIDVPDYSVAFNTNDGFDYKLCEVDGTVLLDNLTDGSEGDEEEQEGVIKVKGLEKGKTYIVKYHGFGEEVEVSQESIGADIDKTYVYSSQFSLISFVPEGTSKRPTGKDLVIDADGVAQYDKADYYSDDSRQSFLMDNYTGLVYKIENIKIARIENRVLYNQDNVPYGFKINDNDELVIFKIVRNETIRYSEVFGDIYNQYYVRTNDFEGIDTEQNTMYYKDLNASYSPYNSFYVVARNGLVLKPTVNNGALYDVKKIARGFVEGEISETENIMIDSNIFSGTSMMSYRFWKIEDGKMYFERESSGGNVTFVRAPLHDSLFIVNSGTMINSAETITVGTLGNDHDYVRVIDHNTVLIYSDIKDVEIVPGLSPNYSFADKFSLYYSYIWGPNENDPNNTTFAFEPDENGQIKPSCVGSRYKLVDGCQVDVDDPAYHSMGISKFKDWDKPRFKQVTFTETVYWKVVMDKGYPEAVNSETYVAPENTSVIIQPINR